jgi:predicted dithiol-disulfide oxidoreductase (DUF899 family)
MGWTFPWACSFGGDFNADFQASTTEQQQRDGAFEYNYQPGQALSLGGEQGPVAEIAAQAGTDAATFMRERPGMSAFALEEARRGGPRDDPKAQQACKRRDQVDERLKRRGCVYQEDGYRGSCRH